jgi:hypothetical protein
LQIVDYGCTRVEIVLESENRLAEMALCDCHSMMWRRSIDVDDVVADVIFDVALWLLQTICSC